MQKVHSSDIDRDSDFDDVTTKLFLKIKPFFHPETHSLKKDPPADQVCVIPDPSHNKVFLKNPSSRTADTYSFDNIFSEDIDLQELYSALYYKSIINQAIPDIPITMIRSQNQLSVVSNHLTLFYGPSGCGKSFSLGFSRPLQLDPPPPDLFGCGKSFSLGFSRPLQLDPPPPDLFGQVSSILDISPFKSKLKNPKSGIIPRFIAHLFHRVYLVEKSFIEEKYRLPISISSASRISKSATIPLPFRKISPKTFSSLSPKMFSHLFSMSVIEFCDDKTFRNLLADGSHAMIHEASKFTKTDRSSSTFSNLSHLLLSSKEFSVTFSTFDDACILLQKAISRRSTEATLLNKHSSRSHVLVCINIMRYEYEWLHYVQKKLVKKLHRQPILKGHHASIDESSSECSITESESSSISQSHPLSSSSRTTKKKKKPVKQEAFQVARFCFIDCAGIEQLNSSHNTLVSARRSSIARKGAPSDYDLADKGPVANVKQLKTTTMFLNQLLEQYLPSLYSSSSKSDHEKVKELIRLNFKSCPFAMCILPFLLSPLRIIVCVSREKEMYSLNKQALKFAQSSHGVILSGKDYYSKSKLDLAHQQGLEAEKALVRVQSHASLTADRLRDAEQEIAKLKEELESLKKENEMFKKIKEELTAEISTLQSNVSTLKAIGRRRDERIISKDNDIEDLQSQISTLEERETELEDLIKAKEEEIDHFERKLEIEASKTKRSEDKCKRLEKDLSKCRSLNDKYLDMLSDSEATYTDKIHQLKEECDSSIEEMKGKMMNMRKKMKILQDDKNSHIKSIEEVMQQSRVLASDNYILRSENVNLKGELDRAKKALSAQKSHEVAQREKDLQKEIHQLRLILKMRDQTIELIKEKNNLILQGDHSTIHLTSSDPSLGRFKGDRTFDCEIEDSGSLGADEMSCISDTSFTELRQTKAEKDTISHLMEQVSGAHHSLHRRVEVLSKSNSDLNDENQLLQARLNAFKIEQNNLQEKHNQLMIKFKDLFEKYRDLEESGLKAKQLIKEHHELTETHDLLVESHTNIQEERDQLKEERDQIQEKQDTLEAEHDRLANDHTVLKDAHTKLEVERDQLKEERGQIQEKQDTLEAEHDRLANDHTVLKDAHTKLEEERDQLKEERDHLQEEQEKEPSESVEPKEPITIEDSVQKDYSTNGTIADIEYEESNDSTDSE
ncbi:Kinesin-like protein like protein, partial [Aduncisulcus paluster]